MDILTKQPQIYAASVQEQEDIDIDVLLAEDEEVDTGTGDVSELIVYNDEVNTFDWVIDCFMDILDHNLQQAEQLSLLIHFKGQATVKTAPKRMLRPKREALVDRGLSAVIEGGK